MPCRGTISAHPWLRLPTRYRFRRYRGEGKEWIVGTVEDVDERKFEQLRGITHMEILRQASLSLTASLDLKDVLDTIAQCALDLVPGMRNCHIFLYQPGNGKQLFFGTALLGDGRNKRKNK